MPRREHRHHLLVLPLAAFLAILPLLVNGPSCGHDFDFHLLSWLEAARQFAAGNLHPHWTYSPAWNAGEPRFVFYPPLSWTLGAILTLLLTHLPGLSQPAGFTLAPTLYTGLALFAGGLSLYALARRYVSQNASLIAATFYLVNPYTLFTAYERTAYGELLAAAWIPLLLAAILPPPSAPDDGRLSIPRLAIPLTLLWLTNAPAAVMASYTVALVLLLRLAHLWQQTHDRGPSLRLALHAVAGTAMGLALPAFYIVPAAYEQRWVEINMATIAGMRIEDNFLFGHAPTTLPDAAAHDTVLHTASLVATLLLGLTAMLLACFAVLRRRRSEPASTAQLLPLAAITLGIAALLLPGSLILWRHLPELAFLQFPWRLLAILAPVCALSFGLTLGKLAWSLPTTVLCSTALAVLCLWPAYHSFRQGCDVEDTPTARLALFQTGGGTEQTGGGTEQTGGGTEPTDEYTPNTADNDALHPGNPAFRVASPDDSPASQAPAAGASAPAPGHLDLDAPRPETLILNLRDYPAWQVRINGLLVPERHARDDGLLAVPVPAGHDHITLTYARTIDQSVGEAISGTAALVLLAIGWRRSQRPRLPAR